MEGSPNVAKNLFTIKSYSLSSVSEDMSDKMLALYRGAGIFASEEPVRQTSKRLENLSPKMIFPMHGSCIDGSVFSKYIEAILNNNFAYTDVVLGQKLERVS
jgi:hypothetical protein